MIAEGCRPTAICFSSLPAFKSTTDTEPSLAMWRFESTRTGSPRPEGPVVERASGNLPAQLLTNARWPTRTTPNGALPTAISRLTAPVDRSISASALRRLNAAHSVRPSPAMARPTGSTPSGSWLPEASLMGASAFRPPVSLTLKTLIVPSMLEARTCLPSGVNTIPA